MNTKCQDSIKETIAISPNTTFTTSNPSTNSIPISSQINFTLNSIPESIIIISEKGKIIEINSAASRLFGWTKDEIINKKDINYILTSRDGEKLLELLKDNLNSLFESSQFLHGVKKNGSTFPCEVTFGIFPKVLLNSTTSISVNTPIIAVFNTNKRNRLSDSVSLNLQSRYQKEYDEIKSLGKGGFGSVYKARNRLDGQLYAIKKIKLQSKPKQFDNSFNLEDIANPNQSPKNYGSKNMDLSFFSDEDIRIIREVKTFARISNHPNIVRYHGSWIEVEERCSKSKNKKKNINDDDEEYDEDEDENSEEDDEDDSSSNSSSSSSEDESNEDSLGEEESYNHHHYSSIENDNSNSKKIQNYQDDVIIVFGEENDDDDDDDEKTPITEKTTTKSKNEWHSKDENSNEFFIDMNALDNGINSKSSLNNSSSYNKSKNQQHMLEEEDEEEDSSFIKFTNTNSNSNLNSNSNSNLNHNVNKKTNINNTTTTTTTTTSTTNYKIKKHNKQNKLFPRKIKTNFSKTTKKSRKNKNKLSMYLLIQMELCSGQTLEKWISERNQSKKKDSIVNRKLVFKIFKQVVQAIAHVHWNGCIHRDIKPANVFFQDDDHILLGDFGLAKDVDITNSGSKSSSPTITSTSPSSSSSSSIYSDKLSREGMSESTLEQEEEGNSQHELTSGVGTYLYASPEQLASLHGYDNKTDIYSLGILLFELLWPFNTGMERIHTLTNLRKGIFPDGFVEKWPLELSFLRSLLNTDPEQRPTAQEILDSEVLNTSYITPLYNNPTNLLSALDLRVTREPVEPECVRSPSLNKYSHSLCRKGHKKTHSIANKNFQYGDCGACRQKDMAITSFRSQFLKTKDTINLLESTINKISLRVWIMSILMFILGCLFTMAVMFIFFTPGKTIYVSADDHLNSNINENVKNLELQSLSPLSNIPVPTTTSNVLTSVSDNFVNNYSYPTSTPQKKIEKQKDSKTSDKKLHKKSSTAEDKNKNNGNSENSFKNQKITIRKRIVATQTLSINYVYNSQIVTFTRTRTVHLMSKTTNSQDTNTPALN